MARKKAKREYGGGSVYEAPKGSGRWYAAIRIGGDLIRRRAVDESAAKTELEQLRSAKRRKLDIHSGLQLFEDWLNVYHAEKQRNDPKPRTNEFRRDKIEGYIIPALGGVRLCDIRPGDIQAMLDAIHADIRTNTRYDGIRTVHAVAAIMHEACTLAFARKLIPENPYSGINLPKYRRKPIEPLTDAQVGALFAAVRGTRLEALWWCYALLGLRRGEGLGLQWMGYDTAAGTLRISQQVQRVGSGDVRISTPKTEDSTRTLPVPRRLSARLAARWTDAQAERQLKNWQEHTLIFCSSVGTPMWPDNLETMFRKLRAAAGLPSTVKLHHLRHTLSTLLDECGATEALKAGILGHAKQTQTQRYTHARIAAMRTVLQAVEDRLLGAFESNIDSNNQQAVG